VNKSIIIVTYPGLLIGEKGGDSGDEGTSMIGNVSPPASDDKLAETAC
jgi:hypothetical protein